VTEVTAEEVETAMTGLVNKSASITSASGSVHTFTAAESNTTAAGEVQVTATFTGQATEWDDTAQASAISRIADELSISPSRIKVEAVFEGSIVILFIIDNPTPAPSPPETPTTEPDSISEWVFIVAGVAAGLVGLGLIKLGATMAVSQARKNSVVTTEATLTPTVVEISVSAEDGEEKTTNKDKYVENMSSDDEIEVIPGQVVGAVVEIAVSSEDPENKGTNKGKYEENMSSVDEIQVVPGRVGAAYSLEDVESPQESQPNPGVPAP